MITAGWQPLLLRWLQTAAAGDEADFNATFHGGGDAIEHGQRMTFVIGILEPRNYGLGGADAFGQLRLREAGALSQFVDTLGHFAVGYFLLKGLLAFWVKAGDIRQNLGGVGGG